MDARCRERNGGDQQSNGGDQRQSRLTTGAVSFRADVSRRSLQGRPQSASDVRHRTKEEREPQLLGAGVPTAAVGLGTAKVLIGLSFFSYC